MRPDAMMPPCGVYLVTPDEHDTARLVARVAALLPGRPALLQYRNKVASPALQRDQARALLALCTDFGTPLVVNDDWRLAAELGAAGAHLGGDDGDLAQARAALGPGSILGASCYDSLERAAAAATAGASYLAFGTCFASGTKPLARRAPLSLFAQARPFGLPTVAIGGISTDNGGLAVDAGANLLALIAGVFDAPNPLAALRTLTSLFPPSPDDET